MTEETDGSLCSNLYYCYHTRGGEASQCLCKINMVTTGRETPSLHPMDYPLEIWMECLECLRLSNTKIESIIFADSHIFLVSGDLLGVTHISISARLASWVGGSVCLTLIILVHLSHTMVTSLVNIGPMLTRDGGLVRQLTSKRS